MRPSFAGRLAACGLALACVCCQPHDTAAEVGRVRSVAANLRFISEVQELPPAGDSTSQLNAPDARPAPAPLDENIRPGMPQPLPGDRPSPGDRGSPGDQPPPGEQVLQQDAQSLAAGQGELPPIQTLTINIQPSAGELPENMAATLFARRPTIIVPPAAPAPEFKYTGWPRISGICNQPLYFEEPAAERYGITGPLQPLCSAAHFFGCAFVLPVKVALHPPREMVCNERYSPNPDRPWLRQHPIVRRTVSTGLAITYTAVFLMP